MESITKNRQTPETLRAMIAKAFGPAQVPAGGDFAAELGHGWFNVAYRLRLADGRQVVLKIAPPPDVEVMTYERDAMDTELAALALIREHTGVPVPDILFADADRGLCGAPYFFMPYIDADNLGIVKETLSAAEIAAYWEQLGALNAELSTITGPGFGPLLDPRFPTWRAAFTAMAADVLADGERRGVDLGFDYDTVRAVLSEHEGSLDEVAEPRFVEWDLWPSNAMAEAGRIVCVIDHERAFWGDPLMRAGFCGGDPPALGDPAAFARGWGRGPLTPTERVRRRLYNLYLLLIMVIETDYRGHTEPTQYDWARARLADLMALFGPRPRA
ncbi:phosphotransferase family protein [Glycomyces terrestris]|uniref:Aminoglycoside phosphotransferase family protein n=1 Tax=Glycomyces terrestris TaxID=2493553 RepID=A0A426V3D0_9ACTN|nr:aminoglycoside phosphotransferase family protein [Glycomyces terrestris]RRS01341.1 aminoglycoside phosphotransferase family protein [Glycomyces terrestris]